MYNLLVSADEEAWEGTEYLFDRSRYLEYTNDKIFKEFRDLTLDNIERIKSMPCLFAYEGIDSNIYIGFFTSIKERNQSKSILMKFKIERNITFTFKDVELIAEYLDIRRWEINRTHWAIKDDDLFNRLIDNGIIEKKIRRSLIKNESKLKIDTFNPINKPIESLQEFISKVLDNELKNSVETFYRGHSKDTYRLVPSILRTDEEGNLLYLEKEDILYKELISSNPKDFREDFHTIDKLMRMQHYSLPTRLLDITSNPLIALFFACNANKDDIGEVIIFKINKTEIKYFDSDTVSCIANLARLPQDEIKKIKFFSKNYILKFNEQMSIDRLIHLIKEEKPFFKSKIKQNDLRRIICVKGKKHNDRVSSQSGAFLLFGHEAVFNEIGMKGIEVLRVAIKNKKRILHELDQLNINESTVFPYIENSAKYIANKFMHHQ